ncbi:MAG TPA: hypothetical protein VJX67_13385 [Blastocatellia bacterium]|nr:hypothetical protein [Blastocatellia bacterium]
MAAPRTGIRLLESDRSCLRAFNAGVSLHCHTQQSREILDFIPYYASRIPIVSGFYKREIENHRLKNGEAIDFAKAYWNPPVTPRGVLDSESEQIRRDLGLEPIVSITDHDDIRACAHLQVIHPEREIPVSLEWTVPYVNGFFHLGVHNLSRRDAGELWGALLAYTRGHQESGLGELLDTLASNPETLIVLNHPMWDIEFAGERKHLELLKGFVAAYGRWIHAIEVNGYRSWAENKKAIELANQHGYPVVSGGDRHGHEANAMLNLTSASTFSGFVGEIRHDRVSEVAIVPGYTEPLVMRMLETAADVLRYYPGYPKGQRFWTDRVFWTLEDGSVRPMSFYWGNGGPSWVKASLAIMRMIGSRHFRPAMRLVFAREEGAGL